MIIFNLSIFQISKLLMWFQRQPPLRIQCRHTSAACCCYGLPVNSVLHIAGCKYTFQICSGTARNGFDISGFIHIQPFFENGGIGFMTDGHKKTIYRNGFQLCRSPYFLFVRRPRGSPREFLPPRYSSKFLYWMLPGCAAA